MDFTLSPELEELRTRVRRLVTNSSKPLDFKAGKNQGRIGPKAQAKVNKAVLDARLNAANIPIEHGGGGFNLTQQIVMHEQLGRLTNCLWVLVWSPGNVLVHGSPEQIEKYLLPAVRGEKMYSYAITEEHAGSDPRAIRAEAIRDGDEYRLSGVKWFVTDGDVADFLIVLAWAVDGDERRPALFIVDKDLPGVEMTDDPDFTHNFPYRHPEYTLTDVRVPAGAVLGEVGQGFDLTGEWFIEERVHIAARCCGACDGLMGIGTEWPLEREQFGSRIFDHQAIAFMLA